MLIAPRKGRDDDLPHRAARARDRHPSRRRDAAALGGRHHGHHQGEHPVADRLRRQLASRLASRSSTWSRGGAPARARRHAVSADRRAEARPLAGGAHHGLRDLAARRLLGRSRRGRRNLLDVEFAPIEDDDKKRDVDPLCYEAAVFIIDSNFASTAQLQQRFSIGHPRAVRVMKHLEEFVCRRSARRARSLGRSTSVAASSNRSRDRLGRDEQLALDV